MPFSEVPLLLYLALHFPLFLSWFLDLWEITAHSAVIKLLLTVQQTPPMIYIKLWKHSGELSLKNTRIRNLWKKTWKVEKLQVSSIFRNIQRASHLIYSL